ncbi:hypothetical protein IIA79_03005 [bacterium]|nr:hypothetical protein [bacterium]
MNSEKETKAVEPKTDDDLDTSKIIVTGTAGIIFTIVSVLWLQAMFYVEDKNEFKIKNYPVTTMEIKELNNLQVQQLYGGYSWIDRDRGIVAIPVDSAMVLVEKELSVPGAESWGGSSLIEPAPVEEEQVIVGRDSVPANHKPMAGTESRPTKAEPVEEDQADEGSEADETDE